MGSLALPLPLTSLTWLVLATGCWVPRTKSSGLNGAAFAGSLGEWSRLRFFVGGEAISWAATEIGMLLRNAFQLEEGAGFPPDGAAGEAVFAALDAAFTTDMIDEEAVQPLFTLLLLL